jgi:hypothetical protein
MTKALAVVLGLALSSGVVYAQAAQPTKSTPAKRSPRPKRAPAKPDKAPDPAPASDARPDAAPPAPAPTPASPPAPGPAPARPAPRPRDKPGTDEKAGVNESLEGAATEPWKVGVPQSEQGAALVQFREGNVALNDGLFVNAVAKYREALKHWNHPAIHYNLSLALLNLDQPIAVYEELNKALLYGAAPLDKEKFNNAKDYLLLVEKQLADIEVSCDKVGAKVSVDGKEVFTAPGKFSQKVRVGKHTFHAVKEGHNARIVAPYIGPGEKYRIELKVYTLDDTTRYRTKWQNTWFPYAVLGAGAVVGLTAGALELSAQSSYDEFNTRVAACNTTTAGCPTATPGIVSLRDSGNTKRTLGYVGYGVAGAAVVTGAILLYINRQQAYQITPEELEAGHAPVAVAPIVSPEIVGAMVQGHF